MIRIQASYKFMTCSLLLALLAITLGKGHANSTPLPTAQRACAPTAQDVCVTLTPESYFRKKTEGIFKLKIELPRAGVVQALAVELKMPGMDHKNAPVDLNSLAKNEFRVQNAWFSMKGKWLILVSFNFENKSYMVQFPINILE